MLEADRNRRVESLALALVEVIATVVEHEVEHRSLRKLGLLVDDQAAVSDRGADSHGGSIAPETVGLVYDRPVSDAPVDVLIICALPEELDALREVCEGVAEPWTKIDGKPPYHVAVFDGRSGSIRVAAARQTKTAGMTTAIVATKLSARLDPRCLAMCGVCAGHPDDTDLGDVVIADRVFQHDVGKLKDTGFEGDIETHNLDDDWRRIAQDLAGPAKHLHGYAKPDDETACWWFLERLADGYDPQTSGYLRYFHEEHGVGLLDELERRGHVEQPDAYVLTEAGALAVKQRRSRQKSVTVKTSPYHIHVGPIGSGNYVAADGSDWARLRNSGMRRVLGIEQEVATVGEVAHQHGRLPFVVAKGVMDHACPHKNDRYKKFAARASAEVLCDFLRRVIEPQRHAADSPGPSAIFERPNLETRFIGRGADLADLERLLRANPGSTVIVAGTVVVSGDVVIVTGIGGIGKTTLVSQFVTKRARELFPDGVVWIDGSHERFVAELARVCRRFGWSKKDAPTPAETCTWLKDRLASKRVLLVVDNFEPEKSPPEYVPIPGGESRTIVTSRKRTLDLQLDGAVPLELGIWTPEVCRGYLRDHCRRDCRWLTIASERELDELAEFVGRLPLGLRLLVCVLRNRPELRPAELLPLLRAQPLGTLDGFDRDRGIEATFRLAYGDLDDAQRRTLQALAACARQTRAEIVAAVAEEADFARVGKSLGYLRTHGFAELPEHGVWGMHDVVRMFVLAQPGAEEYEQRQLDWVQRHLWEHAGETAWQEFAEGVEEAKHAFERWLTRDLAAAGEIYDPLNRHLMVVGRNLSDAVQLSRSLLGVVPSDSAMAAVSLGNLGGCYLTMADFLTAIEHYDRALAINNKLGDCEGQARTIGNLGLCYRRMGNISKAIDYHQRSLTINEELMRIDGQADQLGNLGLCYRILGDFPKAIEHLERSLTLNKNLGRLEGRANQLGNLGVCYRRSGNLPLAIECHERALTINQNLGRLGGQANQLTNLGLCHEDLGETSAALDYLNRARELFRQMGLPDDHPHVAILRNALARLA